MTTHVSASPREHTPHVNRTTRTATIMNALKQRALSVLNDESIDVQTRAILRHALEEHDPWLARLVRQAEASQSNEASEEELPRRVEALAEVICAAGDEAAAALLVLMGTLQDAADPKALAHTTKHLAFIRCGELNVRGMVDSQIALLRDELFRG